MSAREQFTAEDFERRERRKNWNVKRPKGSIPALSDEILDDAEWLRDWLTAVLRPRAGWRIVDFDHGEDPDQPCALVVANGQNQVRYRFRSQGELRSSATRMRTSIAAIANGQLRPPQLKTAEEFGDVMLALFALAPALAAEDELEQAKDWLFQLLDASRPLEGHSLSDSAARRDALLALKRLPEFTRLDALTVIRNPDLPWPRKPVCLIDQVSGEMWLRARESATFLRHVIGMTIRQGTLTYRWNEIGVAYRYFQARPRRVGDPHPQAHLYLIPKIGGSE